MLFSEIHRLANSSKKYYYHSRFTNTLLMILDKKFNVVRNKEVAERLYESFMNHVVNISEIYRHENLIILALYYMDKFLKREHINERNIIQYFNITLDLAEEHLCYSDKRVSEQLRIPKHEMVINRDTYDQICEEFYV